jgi:hypothetical protein
MHRIRGLITFIVGLSLVMAPSVAAEPLIASEPPSNYLSSVFITGFQTSQIATGNELATKLDSIEFYNSSTNAVAMNGWMIDAFAASSGAPLCTLTVAPSNEITYIRPNSYAILAQNGVFAPSDNIRFFQNDCAQAGQIISSISLRSPTQTEDNIQSIPSAGAYVRRGITSSYRDQDPFASNFINLSAMSGTGARSPQVMYTGGWYTPVADAQIRIVEIYPDTASCAPNNTTSICTDYVKLYNPTSVSIDLSNYRIRTGSQGSNATTSNTAALSGMLNSGHYISVAMTLSSSGSWVWLEDNVGVRLYDTTVIGYPSSSGHAQQAWSFNLYTNAWQWTAYPTPGDEPNRFTDGNETSNPCSGLRLSEIAANTDTQFIEVYNQTSDVLDISGCQLQTNRSQSISYIFGNGTMLASGQSLSVYIARTPLTLTKTTTGVVYILDSMGTTEVDSQQYSNLKENTSWALIEGEWRQTYDITPDQANRYAEYPACQTGYYRNNETGNCNKITVSSELAACAANQYRSEETNRCRLLASTASSLQSCAANQFRNPETNRCRLLVSADSNLQPCAAGQERNLETNRCRKVLGSAVSEAGQKLEDTPSSGSTIGWIAFAVVGLLAVGYAIWEWRRELGGFFGSMIGNIKRG